MTALDDIAFLARSQNRVTVLETLSSGPHDRAELQEATGISRPTVGRIVTEFQARGLVSQRKNQYTTSPLGDFLATEFRSLLEGAETMRQLRGVIEWLPTDEFDFTLDHFADATITLVKLSDAIAPVYRAIELLENADHLHLLASSFVPASFEAHWRATVNGTQTSEVVVTADIIDTILADEELTKRLEEIIRSDTATFSCYDGMIPYGAVFTADDVAVFALVDEHGAPQTIIETEDEAIRSWITATIDAHQRDANRLDPDAFTS